jgi:hypothetical protein
VVVARALAREAAEKVEAAKPAKKKTADGIPAFLRRETARNAPAIKPPVAPERKLLSLREPIAKQQATSQTRPRS